MYLEQAAEDFGRQRVWAQTRMSRGTRNISTSLRRHLRMNHLPERLGLVSYKRRANYIRNGRLTTRN